MLWTERSRTAGVGKGRQIAGIIKLMWLLGTRRILWVSHNNDLREDARRDMVDTNIIVPSSHHTKPSKRARQGVVIDVWPPGNKPASKGLNQAPAGVLFITYNMLIGGTQGANSRLLSLED